VVATAGVTVAQAGTSAYFGGQLVTAYEAPLEMVEYAARKAVVVLQFDPRVDRRGDNSLYLMARGLDGREVSIRVESASPAVTRLKIRVGVWGDQAVSRIIQRQVEEELSLAGIAP
jgi:hypothetical protein